MLLSVYPYVAEELTSNCTWCDCATSQAQFVLGKKVSIMWFRCEHLDNRLGASFEPIHVVAMQQCSLVDSPSTSIKISFAGRSAVVGKENSATNRFLQVLPLPMTAKEETSNGLTDNETAGSHKY